MLALADGDAGLAPLILAEVADHGPPQFCEEIGRVVDIARAQGRPTATAAEVRAMFRAARS